MHGRPLRDLVLYEQDALPELGRQLLEEIHARDQPLFAYQAHMRLAAVEAEVTVPGGIIIVSSAAGLANALSAGLSSSVKRLFRKK